MQNDQIAVSVSELHAIVADNIPVTITLVCGMPTIFGPALSSGATTANWDFTGEVLLSVTTDVEHVVMHGTQALLLGEGNLHTTPAFWWASERHADQQRLQACPDSLAFRLNLCTMYCPFGVPFADATSIVHWMLLQITLPG